MTQNKLKKLSKCTRVWNGSGTTICKQKEFHSGNIEKHTPPHNLLSFIKRWSPIWEISSYPWHNWKELSSIFSIITLSCIKSSSMSQPLRCTIYKFIIYRVLTFYINYEVWRINCLKGYMITYLHYRWFIIEG